MRTTTALRLARLARVPAALALVATLGCAASGLTPIRSNQPVARQQLAPEYRVFYDALADYGDWVLIEPYGFVFRPRVSWNQWQPFVDGFWAPTDAWGWVWISAEPFGWATYHYGDWFFDRYQGWVWTPGLDWMPGSVSWLVAGDYVGWAPLQARAASRLDASPAAANTAVQFVPMARLGSTDLRTYLVPAPRIGSLLTQARPIRNETQVEGTVVDRGPPIAMVEERSGPLVRARLEDLVSVDLGLGAAGPPARGPAAERPRPGSQADSIAAAAREAIERTQRAAERAASQAQRLGRLPNANPATVPVVRPLFGPRDRVGARSPLGRRRAADAERGTAPDTTR